MSSAAAEQTAAMDDRWQVVDQRQTHATETEVRAGFLWCSVTVTASDVWALRLPQTARVLGITGPKPWTARGFYMEAAHRRRG